MFGRLLDAQVGPRPRPDSIATAHTWWLVPPVWWALPGLERSMDTGDLHHSALTMTGLAVALRRFRLAHGEYPEALTALAPGYMASVSSDSLTSTLPLYTRQADGFTLRSEHPKADERPMTSALTWKVTR